jgi:CHAT domain-containing protein
VVFLLGCHKAEVPPGVRFSNIQKEFRQGHLDLAIDMADRSYRELEPRDRQWSWRFRLLEADMLLWRGVPEETLALLAGIPPDSAPSEIAIRKAIVQARALCRVGKAVEAQGPLNQAASLVGSSEGSLQAELAFARGKCTPAPAAAPYYQQAAELAHGVDPFNEANALIYVGYFLLQDKHYRAAISRFREALDLSSSLPVLQERVLGNLGYAYVQTGDFKRAINSSSQAERVAAELARLNQQESWLRSDQARWLIDLGQGQLTQLQYPEADASLSKALSITRELRDQEQTAICLDDLAQVALRAKDLGKAEDYTRQLESLNPKNKRYLDVLLNKAELAKARSEFSTAEPLLQEFLDKARHYKDIEPYVIWTAQSDLAAVYVAQKKFEPAEKMFRQAIMTAESARAKIEGTEVRITFLDQAPFYDHYVQFLVSRGRPWDALCIAELGRSPTLSEGMEDSRGRLSPGISLERVQTAVKRHQKIVLAYWLGLEESYLWVLTPSRQKFFFRLPAETDIEEKVDAYNKEIIESEQPENSETGKDLYRILVDPAKGLIPKDASVVIVPHRNLHKFNFETLIVPGSQHNWIEDVHVEYASFLSALTTERTRSANRTLEMLLFGAPILADKQYPVLKQAPAELQKVASYFGADQEVVAAGKDATPQRYIYSNPGRFRLLHFATHGTSSTVLQNPLDSAIVLSPNQSNSASSSADPERTYLLSGMDIMKTPLHADLVVISACYGLGREYSGEGLVGLEWAFMRAGAHQVIAAHWEVDDASGPQLMDDFYREYTHGKSTADALRDAKLKMLHSPDVHRHPYYWASLQLYTGS